MNFVQGIFAFFGPFTAPFSLNRPSPDPATGWVRALSPAALRSYLCAEPGAGLSVKFTPRAAFSSTVRCTSIWSRSITFSRAPSVM